MPVFEPRYPHKYFLTVCCCCCLLLLTLDPKMGVKPPLGKTQLCNQAFALIPDWVARDVNDVPFYILQVYPRVCNVIKVS